MRDLVEAIGDYLSRELRCGYTVYADDELGWSIDLDVVSDWVIEVTFEPDTGQVMLCVRTPDGLGSGSSFPAFTSCRTFDPTSESFLSDLLGATEFLAAEFKSIPASGWFVDDPDTMKAICAVIVKEERCELMRELGEVNGDDKEEE